MIGVTKLKMLVNQRSATKLASGVFILILKKLPATQAY